MNASITSLGPRRAEGAAESISSIGRPSASATVLGHHHALARREPVGLHDDGRAFRLRTCALAAVRIREHARMLPSARPPTSQTALVKALGGLQLRRLRRRPEAPGAPPPAAVVGHPGRERRLRPHDHQLDGVLAAELRDDRPAVERCRDRRIPRSAAMPALPGAAIILSHLGFCSVAQASACSRPPPPRMRMFMAGSPCRCPSLRHGRRRAKAPRRPDQVLAQQELARDRPHGQPDPQIQQPPGARPGEDRRQCPRPVSQRDEEDEGRAHARPARRPADPRIAPKPQPSSTTVSR